MNRTAENCKIFLYILNVVLAGFGLFYVNVGWVMFSNIQSHEYIDDTTIIPITIQIFGTIMILLSWQSFYGLITQKAGYLTSNSVLNLILMLLQIYFTCYLWLGLPAEVLHTAPYLWCLGVHIIKFSIVIPIAYELVSFPMSCYVADVMRNSESLIEGNAYESPA